VEPSENRDDGGDDPARARPESARNRSPRVRLDTLVVERGIAASLQQAQALLLSNAIAVDGKRDVKAGASVRIDATVALVGEPPRYVSRGGLKLEHALDQFALSPHGLAALDIGASTGGFTDCLLQRGARHVYAVDVGRGQLHQRLRLDSRVTLLERTNARYLTQLPEPLGCCTIDVSFISLGLIVPAILPLLLAEAWMVLLIKPQFEAGARDVRKGVVRDPSVRRDTVARVLSTIVREGLDIQGLATSPIRGPAGNHEYLAYARLATGTASDPAYLMESIAW